MYQAPPTGRLTLAATTQAQPPTTPSARGAPGVYLRYLIVITIVVVIIIVIVIIVIFIAIAIVIIVQLSCQQEESTWFASGILIRLVSLQKFLKLG